MQSFICVLAFKSDLFDYIVILLQIHQMKKNIAKTFGVCRSNGRVELVFVHLCHIFTFVRSAVGD